MSKIEKERALRLWQAILEYGDARYDSGNEGNSGEFHSERDARACVRAEQSTTNNLIDAFLAATGWEPVLTPEGEVSGDLGSWTLEAGR